MTIIVNLEIEDEPLFNRKCMRCDSEQFRAVKFIPFEGHRTYNERLSCIVEPFQSGDKQSQTTFPMSVCLGCHRLASLV